MVSRGLSTFFKMVPRRGLEPPRPCEHQHLKLACLPISPPGQGMNRRVDGTRNILPSLTLVKDINNKGATLVLIINSQGGYI